MLVPMLMLLDNKKSRQTGLKLKGRERDSYDLYD